MTTKQTIVIYHANCLDGFGAAYAAWVKFGESADYIPAKYGDLPPDVWGKTVYILDFSYPRETLLPMIDQAKSLVLIDHHQSAKADLEGISNAFFDESCSGAVLAWVHFHPHAFPPKLLLHTQDRDLWQFKFTNTRAITTAIYESVPFDFETWDHYAKATYLLNELEVEGEKILKKRDAEITKFSERCHAVTIAGCTGLAVNAPECYASELGHKLAKASKTFGVVYSFDGQKWRYSLRSENDYDVAAIAEKANGGGHKNAAGFSSYSLIF